MSDMRPENPRVVSSTLTLGTSETAENKGFGEPSGESEQFTESRRLEDEIRKNMKGLGFDV